VDWRRGATTIRFSCEAPRGVQVTTALRVPSEPTAVQGVSESKYEDGVLWLRHPGDPAGTRVELNF